LQSNTTLWQGDCLELMKDIPDGSVDLTVTSPPYDNLRTYNGNISQWSFAKFQGIAKELYRVTKQGGVVVWVVGDATIKGSETGTSFRQALYFKDIGFNLHDTMIYKKNGTGACGSNLAYWQTFEYMFILSKGKPAYVHRLDNGKSRSKGGKKIGRITPDGKQKVEIRSDGDGKLQLRNNVWEYNVGFCSGDDKTSHPAVFPEQLANDHILSWSKENDIVFDPFMGSGTTAKMALLNNRNYIGFELSEEYCKIAEERIQKALAEKEVGE
jgi:site-specific DNA-methyltransferase (adenine-specific)